MSIVTYYESVIYDFDVDNKIDIVTMENEFNKKKKYDCAFIDWEIDCGDSKEIITSLYGKIPYMIIISSYAHEKKLNEWAKIRNIQLLQKPISIWNIESCLYYARTLSNNRRICG